MRIAATVIFFNPDPGVITNVLTYARQVEKIYVIDNSTIMNDVVMDGIGAIPNVEYINNAGNQGIAHALNVGARRACEAGFDWLLTMDQDTRLPQDFIGRLSSNTQEAATATLGIIAPRYEGGTYDSGVPAQDIVWTMTSGNLMNLRAFEAVGPLKIELFIDHVDHEYCLRLVQNGWRILQDNTIALPHRPGHIITVNFLVLKLRFSTHSPSRLYYFCRNGFYVSRLYGSQFPEFARAFRKLFMKEVVKIPFQSQRYERIKLLYRAYSDFLNDRFGPLKPRL